MNGSYRALLVGVPTYRDDAIDDLPFVTSDMAELEEVLSSAGYDVTPHDVEETDRDSIDLAIEDFFRDAAEGETLLIYLSGHGIHHDGKDYLVPKGARTRSHDFRGKCLPLDFSGYAERSRAGDVVVFVDACREGIVLKEMAAVNAAGWSDMRVARAGARHYCHVYACSPGERARYTTAGNITFSIFSRALSTVVADEAGPRTLSELQEQLQTATDALTAEHSLPRQQVRLRTETDTDGFLVFERPDRTVPDASGEHAWVAAAQQHPAWQQIGDGPGANAMREAVVALVTHLAAQTDRDDARLADDPWRPVGFAERMTDRVGWLLSKVLNPEKLALSPAEAALLVAVPFVYVSCANRAAAEALGADPENLARLESPSAERVGYEHFFSNHSRLVRRAELAARSGGRDRAAGIAWWLFRRWLARKPGGFQERVLADLLGPVECLVECVTVPADRKLVTELFELETLSTLLRSLRASFDVTSIRPERQLAGGSGAEQHIREQLLVVLLTVAHQLAIDPVALSDVVVEHLGISYSVDMAELHQTIQTARWDPRGRTRVLNAACRHPAVGLALRQQAAALDTVLGMVDVQAGSEAQLAPLQDLPVHATADQVHAAADARGRPAYESTDLRFRLADDRIQELLMGEQLYGDPALAVRELYQNALDACRYRGARTAYLRRRNPELPPWSGRITFTQGVDEHGRAYIDCTDNGIGMGERELREVFSYAGMRFADLPEYLDEQADWRTEGIEFHPNSRFGIGVLSYFMIADDVSVTTCRLDREGHPGHRLRVDIAGPGSLFYIRDLGRGHDAGTTVRLYLRPSGTPPSCTDLLRRLLWISEYSVIAEDAQTRLVWEPNVLSPEAPLGARDPHAAKAKRADGVRADATSRSDVWWVSTHGGVLADGVWIGVPLFGAVVDLTGRYAPQLTVDRRRTLNYDRAHVLDLLHQEIPALMREGAEVLDHEWLSELVLEQPVLADAVSDAAVACRYRPWVVVGNELDITAVGCFPADADLFADEPSNAHSTAPVPEYIANWRALAWAVAGMFPGVTVTDPGAVPLARPTDCILFGQSATQVQRTSRRGSNADWFHPEYPVPLGHVLWFAHLVGRSPSEVADRLVASGLRLPEGVVLPETVEADDLVILSGNFDRSEPWLDVTAPVPLGHLLGAAHRSGRTPVEVAGRLAELGLRLPEGVVLPEAVEADDLVILSRDYLRHESRWLWLDVTVAVPVQLGHVFGAAHRSGRTPVQVAARLAELGLRLPEGMKPPEAVEPDDLVILSRDLDGVAPWLDVARPLSLAHVLDAAKQTDRSPAQLADRLLALGLRLPEGVVLPEAVEADDLVILSRGLDAEPPWLDVPAPVPLGHVLGAARAIGRSPAEVAARLTEFGFRLPEGVALPDTAEEDDLLLMSEALDRAAPWLEVTEPVPPGHVLGAAIPMGRRPADVVARLAALGLRLPEGVELPEAVEPDDLLILSRDLDREAPWLGATRPVPLRHVLGAAIRLGRRPADVLARLTELGFRLPEGADHLQAMDVDDLRMFRHGHRRMGRWVDQTTAVTLWDVFRVAVRRRRSVARIARRFRELGFVMAGDASYD